MDRGIREAPGVFDLRQARQLDEKGRDFRPDEMPRRRVVRTTGCCGRDHSPSGSRVRWSVSRARKPPYEAHEPFSEVILARRCPRSPEQGTHIGRRASAVCPRAADRMPQPGDPYARAFIAEPMQCWRMIHDRQGQATHCVEPPSWTGRWFKPLWRALVACVGVSGPPGRSDGAQGVRGVPR